MTAGAPDGSATPDPLAAAGAALKRGDQEGALRRCEQAIALAPGRAEAPSFLAGLLYYCGRLSEAEAACRRALDLEPALAGLRSLPYRAVPGDTWRPQDRLLERQFWDFSVEPEAVAAAVVASLAGGERRFRSDGVT